MAVEYTHSYKYQIVYLIVVRLQNENKKHSENADTFTSVTFDMCCWPYDKVKNAEVI